jgi:hypothetical protein
VRQPFSSMRLGRLTCGADQMLETRKVEYVDEGALLVMNPPGPGHRRIVRRIVTSINRVYQTLTPIEPSVSPVARQFPQPLRQASLGYRGAVRLRNTVPETSCAWF